MTSIFGNSKGCVRGPQVASYKPFTQASATAVRLMLRAQYFMPLYYSLQLYEDDTIPTAATNGVGLWVNPAFWAGLTADERMTMVAHEIGHKMLLHMTRRGGRDPDLWNEAGDYVINIMLVESGFTPLNNMVINGKKTSWLYNAKYAGMTTEAVYDALIKEMEGQDGKTGKAQAQNGGKGKGQGQGSGSAGEAADSDTADEGADDAGGDEADNEAASGRARASRRAAKRLGPLRDLTDAGTDPHGNDTGEKVDPAQLEQQVRKELQEATMIAKMAGSVPAWMQRAIDNAEHSKVAWFEVLEQYLKGMSKSDYSWKRFSRRDFVKTGGICPDIYTPAVGGIVLLVDCSGSIGAQELGVFNRHFNDILEQVKPKWVEVVYFEVGPGKVERFDRAEYQGDTAQLNPIGGGGTSFKWFANHIAAMDEQPDVALCLTDMYGDFGREPDCVPFIWLSNSDVQTAPYGQTISIN